MERGAEVRRGHVVTGLTQHDDRVEVVAFGPGGRSHRLTAAHVVGCDGEQSTVRRLAGFAMTGDDATREMLRADVQGIDIPAGASDGTRTAPPPPTGAATGPPVSWCTTAPVHPGLAPASPSSPRSPRRGPG